MIRKPCVAGQFYPGDPAELKTMVEGFLGKHTPVKAVALIAPHAGYIYSGAVAGEIYSSVLMPDRIVLLGPNHTGRGANASLMPEGRWETPAGDVAVDSELANAILSSSALFSVDPEAHRMEHSLEVQLPFIRSLNPGASIVPITIMRAGPRECAEMGSAIAGVIEATDDDILIVVSSDMNHFDPDDVTHKKDEAAIDRVLSLDADGLLDVTAKMDITMCGVIPSAIAINAAKKLGASEARLVSYATSGDVSGERESVVGYAGILLRAESL